MYFSIELSAWFAWKLTQHVSANQSFNSKTEIILVLDPNLDLKQGKNQVENWQSDLHT